MSEIIINYQNLANQTILGSFGDSAAALAFATKLEENLKHLQSEFGCKTCHARDQWDDSWRKQNGLAGPDVNIKDLKQKNILRMHCLAAMAAASNNWQAACAADKTATLTFGDDVSFTPAQK
jgi:hypothetical protein